MFAFDLAVAQEIQSWHFIGLTTIMRAASWLFTPEVFVPLALVVGLILFMQHRRLQDALFLVLLSGNGLTILLKPIVHRLRPTSNVVQILDHQNGYSLPSGHTVAAIIFSLSIILLVGQKYKRHRWWMTALLMLLAMIVSISRVYLGAHWPTDVLAGWIVGILWVAGVWLAVKPALERWWISRHRTNRE